MGLYIPNLDGKATMNRLLHMNIFVSLMGSAKPKSAGMTLKLDPVKVNPKRHIYTTISIHVPHKKPQCCPVLELGCLQETLTKISTTESKASWDELEIVSGQGQPQKVHLKHQRHPCTTYESPTLPSIGARLFTSNFNQDFNHKSPARMTLKFNSVKINLKNHIYTPRGIHVPKIKLLSHLVLELNCLQETYTKISTTRSKSNWDDLEIESSQGQPQKAHLHHQRHPCTKFESPILSSLGARLFTKNFNQKFMPVRRMDRRTMEVFT